MGRKLDNYENLNSGHMTVKKMKIKTEIIL